MTRHQVLCINKSNRTSEHEKISHIGGINPDKARWKLTQEAAIAAIEAKTYEFYVSDGKNEAEVVVAVSASNNKYLRTKKDGTLTDNLLSLPECP
jgi:uncharacterized membrane protein